MRAMRSATDLSRNGGLPTVPILSIESARSAGVMAVWRASLNPNMQALPAVWDSGLVVVVFARLVRSDPYVINPNRFGKVMLVSLYPSVVVRFGKKSALVELLHR